MIERVSLLGRRFALMLGGELLQAAFHFAFNVALMRVLDIHDYGVFAIVMLIGGLALTYMRALCAVPASLVIATRPVGRHAAANEVAFGSGALLLAAATAIGVTIGLFPLIGAGSLIAGLFLGCWMLRSYLRSILYARREPLRSGLSDAAFAGSGAILAGLLFLGHRVSLDHVFAVLGLANAVSIGAAVLLTRRPVRLAFGPATRRRFVRLRHQLWWSAVGVTTANLQSQGQVILIAAVAGPAAYAPIAAMGVFFAPLRLASTAVANLTQPELAASLAGRDWAAVRHLCIAWAAVLGGIAVVTGVGIAVAFSWIGSGPVFDGQPKMLIAVLTWLTSGAAVLYVLPRVLLEVMREFRLIAIITAASGIIGIACAAVLLVVTTPAWSLTGALLSESIVTVACWLAVMRLMARGHSHERRVPGPSLAAAQMPGR